MPGNASGGMEGVAVKPLTVGFHETQFLGKLNGENKLGFWFQLDDRARQQVGEPWGPSNPQALNRYAYVLNNPLKYTDPTGHCPACAAIAWALGAIGITVSAPAVAIIAAVVSVAALLVFLEDPGNRDWLATQIRGGIDNVEAFAGELSHILESKFRGGKQNSRDRDFGISDKGFWDWWHRGGGKEANGGQNIESREEAEEKYEEWVQQGKPRGSKGERR